MHYGKKRIVAFLDLDGVLHSTKNELIGMDCATEALRVQLVRNEIDPVQLNLLCRQRQAWLAAVLKKYPHIDLCISSAWRGWEGFNWLDPEDRADPLFEARHVETLAWLKRHLLPMISHRIIGKTHFEGTRLQQIRDFMATLDPDVYAPHWVALDDQGAHFPFHAIRPFYCEAMEVGQYDGSVKGDGVVVLIDGVAALTPASALALEQAIAHATHLAGRCAGRAGQAPSGSALGIQYARVQ